MTTPRELILGTAGHIDHGKTALVRALTGIDTDRLAAEKDRGISIDIGFAHLDVDGTRFGIVDLPGHERFIKNMLAGASGVDVALLIVAADDSVMPQTHEHLAILQLLRIPRGLVIITKCDLAAPEWLDLVEEDVRRLVADTFLETAPIVRTSAETGAGLDALRGALAGVAATVPPRADDGCFRLAVDRAFALAGLGTVVTGTIWSGAVRAGDTLDWMPVGKTVRVRGVQSHGRTVPEAGSGARAALDITGAHHSQMLRGHVVATPGYLAPSRRITVRVDVLAESPWPVRHRSSVRLYLGTQEVMAEVRLLAGTELGPGERGLAQLTCADPVAAAAGQPFVVRTASPMRTVGGGIVLQPVARPMARRDRAAIERLDELAHDDPGRRAAAAIRFFADRHWTPAELARDADLRSGEVEAVLARLEEAGTIVSFAVRPTNTARVHRDFLAAAQARVQETLAGLHAVDVLSAAIPRERVIRKLRHLDRDLLLAVLARMIDAGLLQGDDQTVMLPGHAPRLTASQEALHRHVIEQYRSAGFSPPEPAALAGTAGVPEAELAPIISLCVQESHLAHLGGPLYLHRDWEHELRRRIVEGLRDSEGMTVSQIRDLLETSRKYAVPICEYLDRVGVTRRTQDLRTLART